MALKEPFYVVATLTPAPGKSLEVIAALQPFTDHVKAAEASLLLLREPVRSTPITMVQANRDPQPGCLQYEMFQPAGSDVDAADAPIVFVELWKDMEALEIHRNSEQYQALMVRAKNEGLLAAPPDVKVLQPVGGFPLRA